jgi:hypothetical protein
VNARGNLYACNEACSNESTCFGFWLENDLNCWLWVRSIDVKGEYKNDPEKIDVEFT